MLPITAVAFVQLDVLYILAGEGQHLQVFDFQEKTRLLRRQIFDSQAIHGFAYRSLSHVKEHRAKVLIWGGRSIAVLHLRVDPGADKGSRLVASFKVREVELTDSILDGCLRDVDTKDDSRALKTNALLIAAHNNLLTLHAEVLSSDNPSPVPQIYRIASGPSSVLYSAHVTLTEDDRVLVAAGTVFGEVILWSVSTGEGSSSLGPQVHKNFTGHDGSVFGVRISEKIHGGNPEQLLASCSDDRTIRIWDISGEITLLHEEAHTKASPDHSAIERTESLAMVMGHASRIWGLRFLCCREGRWEIITYGEDCTAQIWQLSPAENLECSQEEADSAFTLKNRAIYSHHSGKNIWAIASHAKSSTECIVATGGADGRITTFKSGPDGRTAGNEFLSVQFTPEQVMESVKSTATDVSPNSKYRGLPYVRHIFNGLVGQWNLSRKIQSVRKSYPSGTFEGTASLNARPATDETFAAEYLYSEKGEFMTVEGLKMKATRHYVYRYNADLDSISVWFVKTDDGSTVDYLFHDLRFRDEGSSHLRSENESSFITRTASGYHLCVKDEYIPEYSFKIHDSELQDWSLKFEVIGPEKEYTTTAKYTRNNRADISNVSRSRKNTEPKNDGLALTHSISSPVLGNPITGAFKTYVWISQDELLASTDQGNLLLGTINANPKSGSTEPMIWHEVAHQPELMSSCLAANVSALGLVFFTGKSGMIFVYDHSCHTVNSIHKLAGKAGFLSSQLLRRQEEPYAGAPQVIAIVAACLRSSETTVMLLEHTEDSSEPILQEIRSLHLPLKYTVTSSLIVGFRDIIILGSRFGDLALYEEWTKDNNCKPFVIFSSIHGKETTTTIREIKSDDKSLHILTTGRDGNFAMHQILFSNHSLPDLPPTIQTLHIGTPPFGPNIEGALISHDNLYLWGFRSTQFVVWNETQKTETMTVECGGAHRNWSYFHSEDGKGGGSFVWTKASVCHVQSQAKASHDVMQCGGHGREIKAMAVSPSTSLEDEKGGRLCATGAEDTSIRIFRMDEDDEFRCLSILTKHTTGLQALQWSSDGTLLFSAGGCEEFFVWRITPVPFVTIGTVCEAQCPRVTEESDLRIMDFAVCEIGLQESDKSADTMRSPDYLISMVYSDSSIRIFRYHTNAEGNGGGKFSLLHQGTYTTHCLTQCLYLRTPDELYLCTASTDGCIAFWPVDTPSFTQRLNDCNDAGTQPTDNSTSQRSKAPTTIHSTKRIPLHQSSIKTLTLNPLLQNWTLILTGGDDGAIAILRLTPSTLAPSTNTNTTDPSTNNVLHIPKAHASAVTSITHIPKRSYEAEPGIITHRFASVSSDQRLKTWAVSVDLRKEGVESISVVKEGSVHTSVADASAIEVWEDGEGEEEGEWGGDGKGRRLVLGGIGMESWRVGKRGLERCVARNEDMG